MRITICMKRALLLTVPVVLCIAALACGTSSPPMQPSPAPDAVPKAAQAAPEPSPSTAIPTDTPTMPAPTASIPTPDSTQPETTSSPAASSHVVAGSLDELVEFSTHVVTGRYTNRKTEIHIPNTGPDGQPDNSIVGIGTVYTIEVESYLKGDGAGEIQVVQIEQFRTQSPGEAARVSDLESARFPFERDGRYLLFLMPMPQGRVSSMPDLFLGVAQPYRFKLKDGEARADGPLGDLFRGLHEGTDARFPDTSEQSLVDQVQAIIARTPGQ